MLIEHEFWRKCMTIDRSQPMTAKQKFIEKELKLDAKDMQLEGQKLVNSFYNNYVFTENNRHEDDLLRRADFSQKSDRHNADQESVKEICWRLATTRDSLVNNETLKDFGFQEVRTVPKKPTGPAKPTPTPSKTKDRGIDI